MYHIPTRNRFTCLLSMLSHTASNSRQPGLHSSTMATSPLARYESFLISNASTISTIESSLRSLTWFLPGRFRDAELASEALSATLNLLSLYHDTLLARRMELDPKAKPILPPSVHSRYTRAWAKRDSRYRWAARLLEIVRFIELVVEMGMRRKFKKQTVWKGVFALETIKAALRLFLLKLTRRPVLLPPIPEREIDPAAMSLDPLSEPTNESSTPPRTPDHIKNNRHALPSPLLTPPKGGAKPMPIEDYLMNKALSTDDLRAPTRLMDILASPRDWLAELLFIARPLVYVYLLSRSNKNNKSTALGVSLVIELLSRNLRRAPAPSSQLERAEYARRDRDLLWYFFRGAIWSEWTRPKLDAVAKKTQDAPLLGLLSAFIGDWVPLIDEYYYYTAT
ncbi:Peroxisomal membrane protein PEX16 OS=Yarrowia lipolytica (strain CLIB 122 / E 150) GN=PEX16 PE=3 SV=1 [Rhizoctonia solani AG-1 IB]|uniref:Peroxisomal membrane protein PEX16 n=1 Tax=Thanatephorus cucumeris (strain AG1-IB / isolate 7/3/14) TaxID=1108050 RepID=A0A0B7FNU5_THACB|nr:Peroxisomal membrane protein PEX16 OS=Yarrowia lipolytica (strain CLIB 122 / E 150) GN=PEX16 PE=3 SV=1 [Rhizoctonia solani AG-1 IB]